MTFAVLWSQEAFDALTEIIDANDDYDQIVSAILELDRSLSDDPATKGESRGGGRRIVFSPPLAALYEIHWRMSEVVIGDVWKFDQHDMD